MSWLCSSIPSARSAAMRTSLGTSGDASRTLTESSKGQRRRSSDIMRHATAIRCAARAGVPSGGVTTDPSIGASGSRGGTGRLRTDAVTGRRPLRGIVVDPPGMAVRLSGTRTVRAIHGGYAYFVSLARQEASAQRCLSELAGRGPRDRLDELDAIGQLPLGEAGREVVAQLPRRCGPAIAQDDRGQRPLAPLVVGN